MLRTIPFRLWHHFQTDSLFRNSIYMMASMAIMGVLGFVFWIVVARVFSTSSVGLATALISAMALISNFSLLGFNISLVRYLPKSAKRNEKINAVFFLVTGASIISSLIFIAGLKLFSPQLAFLQTNYFYILTFIFFVIGASINTLIDSIFMAYRVAGNILIKNTIISILKLIFPLLFIFLGSYGIFSAVSLATLISIIFSFIILLSKYNFIPSLRLNLNEVKDMAKFSAGNYVASFLSQAPGLLLPILIINGHKAETAAYYYVSSMILGFLMIISQSTTQSLLAEGSHDISAVRQHFIKSLKLVFALLIPAIIIIVLFGNLILRAFGKSYADESFIFLKIISFSAIFLSISSLGNSLLRLRHQIKYLIIMNNISAIIILGLAYVFIPTGLIGIGWALLLGQIISAVLYIVVLWKKKFL
ncbi:oligosaccharide flippase family protein [Candidatus Roizmanbacteria bacterium]|nr:oligosaccharide flippase family protein [Candidatus Roizmanbacteria bacterium]